MTIVITQTALYWMSVVLAFLLGVLAGILTLGWYAVRSMHKNEQRENPEKVVSHGGSKG